MKYRLVIFDFDGTLADSYPWFVSVLDRVSRKFGFRNLSQDELGELSEYNIRTIMKSLGLPLWKLPSILKYVRSLMSEDAGSIPLFTGIDGVLKHLDDNGLQLGLVSSNTRANAGRILGPDNEKLFSCIECGVSMLGKHTKLKKIMNKSSLKRDDVIYIGDEIRDLESARKIGIDFGAVSWGYNSFESLKAYKPDVLFERVADIRALY